MNRGANLEKRVILEFPNSSAWGRGGLDVSRSGLAQWLGANRDGVWRETGILEKFPPGGPKVLWRQSARRKSSSMWLLRRQIF
jgi:hypothetical protein